MWYSATIIAYDVLDTVHIRVSVRQAGAAIGDPTEPVLQRTTTLPGVGESDAHEWLRDVLVACLEAT